MSDHLIYIKSTETIQRFGLRLRRDKCVWTKRYVEFLGHFVGNSVSAACKHHVKFLFFRFPRNT